LGFLKSNQLDVIGSDLVGETSGGTRASSSKTLVITVPLKGVSYIAGSTQKMIKEHIKMNCD